MFLHPNGGAVGGLDHQHGTPVVGSGGHVSGPVEHDGGPEVPAGELGVKGDI